MAQGSVSFERDTSGEEITETLVLDSNVLIIALLTEDRLNEKERPFRPAAARYIQGIGTTYRFYLPNLAVLETSARIRRRAGLAAGIMARRTFLDWERRGHISLYSLDEDWLEKSIQAAQEHRLTGADGFFVAVAKEFSLSLKTIDKEMLERFSEASLP